jgi:hypothetical protein
MGGSTTGGTNTSPHRYYGDQMRATTSSQPCRVAGEIFTIEMMTDAVVVMVAMPKSWP